MDEAEEEALFARLRASFAALRRDAAAAAGTETGQQPEIMAALARLESTLRTLANGLDTLAQRADALDSGIEARVEQAVARNTAALRLDLNRLENRMTSGPVAATNGAVAARPGSGARVGLFALLLLLVIAAAAAAVEFVRIPRVDELRQMASDRMTALRGMLTGEKPAAVSTPTPAQSSATPLSEPAARPAQASAQAPSAQTNAPPASQTNPPPATASNGAAAAPTSAGKEANAAGDATTPAAAAPSAPTPPNKIVIRATAPAWVEVREHSGNVLLRRTMHTGETWESSGQPDLVLSTGNAPALVLDVNGQPQRLPAGRVVRDFSLP